MSFDVTDPALEGFAAELKALRKELEASLGEEDLAHLRKIERVGKVATAIGFATAPFGPNPVSMIALALGRGTRWILMHHVGHRGYDKVPGVPPKYTSKVFARGKRRHLDWHDWMIPEAWIYEHNVLHHSHTGEEKDPDLVERNTDWLRSEKIPKWFRYGMVAALSVSWKFSYYAPNTLEEWMSRGRRAGDHGLPKGFVKTLLGRCYAPYGIMQFGVIPLLFLPLGPVASVSVLLNSLGAEALTNLHTFMVVGPNHTGDDLYRFDTPPKSKGEAAARQVVGTGNYRSGGDFVDFMHLWLNYQIEHHLFPDMPMLKYREMKPKIIELCAKYGIPYIEESVFTRTRKMVDVVVGNAKMKRTEAPKAVDAKPDPRARSGIGSFLRTATIG